MNRHFLTIVGVCFIVIGLTLTAFAQDNPAGLQNDDVEVYVSAGAFISLQGDDSEIYANGLNSAANPLSVMQGDDTQIFVAPNSSSSLQGDDADVFVPSSNQGVSTTVVGENTVEVSAEPDLAASLPTANLVVFDGISDEVGAGLPNTQLNNWQVVPIDNSLLMIGGGITLILLLSASIFIAHGTLKAVSQ